MFLVSLMNQSKIWDKLYSEGFKWKLEARDVPLGFKGKDVLEIGVGNGKTLQSILRQKPRRVAAVDFSSEAIKIVEEKFKGVECVKANVMDMPFSDNSFDVVVCYFILNNLIEKERVRAVKEIYRTIKKSGILVFMDFAVGDFRELEDCVQLEEHTIQKKSGLICHFFDVGEIKELFFEFGKMKVKLLESEPITHKSFLKRRIISLIARK